MATERKEMPDWREAARERYCHVLLRRLETAETLELIDAFAGRIEWLLSEPTEPVAEPAPLPVPIFCRVCEDSFMSLPALVEHYDEHIAAATRAQDVELEATDGRQ